jgi:hypothetical protein
LLQTTAPLIYFFNLGFHFRGMSLDLKHGQQIGKSETPVSSDLPRGSGGRRLLCANAEYAASATRSSS